MEYKDREGGHALPLFGTKSFVERLPRLGEFIQIGRSLSQCFRASLQKGDGVTIAKDFEKDFRRPVYPLFLRFLQDGLSDPPPCHE